MLRTVRCPISRVVWSSVIIGRNLVIGDFGEDVRHSLTYVARGVLVRVGFRGGDWFWRCREFVFGGSGCA